jgi:hypothetical protein
MSKNVLIPLSLLDKIIDLLEHWDVSKQDYFIRCDYYDVLGELVWKKQKIELRDAYVKIINADNQDSRDDARIEYLRKKRLLKDDIPF